MDSLLVVVQHVRHTYSIKKQKQHSECVLWCKLQLCGDLKNKNKPRG